MATKKPAKLTPRESRYEKTIATLRESCELYQARIRTLERDASYTASLITRLEGRVGEQAAKMLAASVDMKDAIHKAVKDLLGDRILTMDYGGKRFNDVVADAVKEVAKKSASL